MKVVVSAGLGTELFLDTKQSELQICMSWNNHLQNVYISITIVDITWRDFQARMDHEVIHLTICVTQGVELCWMIPVSSLQALAEPKQGEEKKKRGIFSMAWMRLERGKPEQWREIKGKGPDQHLKSVIICLFEVWGAAMDLQNSEESVSVCGHQSHCSGKCLFPSLTYCCWASSFPLSHQMGAVNLNCFWDQLTTTYQEREILLISLSLKLHSPNN